MRHSLTLAAALAIAWSPSLAQSQTGDEQLLRFYLENSALVGHCTDLDFQLDQPALGQKIKTVVNDVSAAGASNERLRAILQESKAASAKNTPDSPSLELGDGDRAQALAKYEAELQIVQQRCDALVQDARMSPYMTRVGYQTTAGEKSHFGRVSYEAANGDADQMFLLGSMYDIGMKPDPDHTLEFTWYLKAAEHGNVNGAGMVSINYLNGRGVAKNPVEAFKWAVICQLSGGTSKYRDAIDPQITTAERQAGRDKALAWLKARD